MSLPYNGKLIQQARNLRKAATKQENHIWYDFLRDYPIRFQRQKTIGSFIADFYCYEAKLVIEIDGGKHYEQQCRMHDEERTRILESCGLHVIRYSNREIDMEFRAVCEQIDRIVKERTEKTAAHASLREGGGPA